MAKFNSLRKKRAKKNQELFIMLKRLENSNCKNRDSLILSCNKLKKSLTRS